MDWKGTKEHSGDQLGSLRYLRVKQSFWIILSHKLLPGFNEIWHFKCLCRDVIHSKGSVNVVIVSFVGSL